MTDRINRIVEAHPDISIRDIALILQHYYNIEWSHPDMTLDQVQNTLDHVTMSLIDRDTSAVKRFVKMLRYDT